MFVFLGSDVARCMLVFAKGKPLGKDGLDWLKIHLINLTGLKKRSPNRERLLFADSIIDKILDSADNPIDVSIVSLFPYYDFQIYIIDISYKIQINHLIYTKNM